jgi:hypothetical protein
LLKTENNLKNKKLTGGSSGIRISALSAEICFNLSAVPEGYVE